MSWRLVFLLGFGLWVTVGVRRGFGRYAWLATIPGLVLFWLLSNAGLARLYGLVIPGDRQRNLSWAMSVAAGNSPFENPILGYYSLEPVFSWLVAAAAGFEEERVLMLYGYVSPLVIALLAAVVYWAVLTDPSDGGTAARDRALIFLFFVVFAATPVLDHLGPYRAYWSRMFLLKPNHACGLVLTILIAVAIQRKRYLAASLVLGLLGWVFIMHWGFVGLALGLLLVWNGVREGFRPSRATWSLLGVGLGGAVLAAPWIYRIAVQFPAAVTLAPGWEVAGGYEAVGPSNWGDALPRGASLLFLVTLDQGLIFWLGLVGAWVWIRSDRDQSRFWLCCLAVGYGLFAVNYGLYLVSTARNADEIYFFLVFALSLAAAEGAYFVYCRLSELARERFGPLRDGAALGVFLACCLPLATPYWWEPHRMDAYYRESLQPIPAEAERLGAWLRQNAQGHDVVIAYGDLAHWAPTLSGRRLASLVDPLRSRLGDLLESNDAPGEGGCDLGLDLGQDLEDGRRVFVIWDEAVRQRLALESVEQSHPCWQFRERLGASSVYEWQAPPSSR